MSKILTFDDYDMSPTPRQTMAIYDSGFQGVLPESRETYTAIRSAMPSFWQAYDEAKGRGAGKLSTPYKACLALDPDFGRTENQTTGDCVSHGTRNAGTVDYSVDSFFGETDFRGRFCTEPIYGARGHGGQGANCSVLANYVSPNGKGGFLPRGKYSNGSETVDLSVYNSRIGANWGRSGTPAWLSELAAANKALRVFAIKSVGEAIDCIHHGFGISMCSGYGFSSTRDKNGVADRRGSWSHCMAWIGVDDTPWAHETYGGPLFLVQNSWGLWNSGPKRHDQPDGSFWIRPEISATMVKGGGGYAIQSVRGYNRELDYDIASDMNRHFSAAA